MPNYQRHKNTSQNTEITQIVDYKNIPFLKVHLMESGRIMPSRITAVPVLMQRQIAKAVKLARFLALLPYTDQQNS
jgi:small subunit ribosomal protein S18